MQACRGCLSRAAAKGRFSPSSWCSLQSKLPAAHLVWRQRWRHFADVPQRVVDTPAVQPGMAGTSALQNLQARGGLMPRPEEFDERLKPGFRGGRALFIFFMCNAAPFCGLLYYLREQREQRAELELTMLPTFAGEVVSEALRVIKTTPVCYLLPPGGCAGGMLMVEPRAPEGTAYVAPSGPLPLVPQLERSSLTDLLESPPVAGLGFIHFALSRNCAAAQAVLAGNRQASLLYSSGTRGAYCTVSGQLSILSDMDARRHYWKSAWSASFPAVSAAPKKGQQSPEAPPQPWTNAECLVLRLSVTDVNLRALVDGPERWECRHARKLPQKTSESDPEWVLLPPDAPP
eukprot:gnl/TRDRNA2_/TRDRNA2_133347_c0_seq1.p1 gnl/TRDRNA2_/TRDRNA2_133347_c0~~gnl/TRDRNA2_/TRDRNA2_133347_c0_seq1.p1  ORF type:complete len:346 (-),score=40.74 gnl/TRDRNA2_/TRDRNA2_133347_c0_seq1:41-1078(-)